MIVSIIENSLYITDTSLNIQIQSHAKLTAATRKNLEKYNKDFPKNRVEVIVLEKQYENPSSAKFIFRHDCIQLSLLVGGIWATITIPADTRNARVVVDYLLSV